MFALSSKISLLCRLLLRDKQASQLSKGPRNLYDGFVMIAV